MYNNIAYINNQLGERIEKHEDMEKEFNDHFQEILREPPGNRDQEIRNIK